VTAPLADITVIEVDNYMAAPSTGAILADMGATVIKVEPLDRRPHARHRPAGEDRRAAEGLRLRLRRRQPRQALDRRGPGQARGRRRRASAGRNGPRCSCAICCPTGSGVSASIPASAVGAQSDAWCTPPSPATAPTGPRRCGPVTTSPPSSAARASTTPCARATTARCPWRAPPRATTPRGSPARRDPGGAAPGGAHGRRPGGGDLAVRDGDLDPGHRLRRHRGGPRARCAGGPGTSSSPRPPTAIPAATASGWC
jgi:hypothetical protein